MGLRASLDMLKRSWISCPCRDFNPRSFVLQPSHRADHLEERYWWGVLVLNWTLSNQPVTESAHAYVKYHNLDLCNWSPQLGAASHCNIWCTKMQQILRCHSLIRWLNFLFFLYHITLILHLNTEFGHPTLIEGDNRSWTEYDNDYDYLFCSFNPATWGHSP